MLPLAAGFAIVLLWKDRNSFKQLKWILGIMLLAYFNMKIASWIAGGFSSSIYLGRWTYCVFFLLALTVVWKADALMQMKNKGLLIVLGIYEVYFGLLMLIGQRYFRDYLTEARLHGLKERMLIIVLLTGILWILQKFQLRKMLYLVLTLSILLNAMNNIKTIFHDYQEFWTLKQYEAIDREFSGNEIQKIQTYDNSFSRIDVQGNIRNTALYMGYHSANEYLSMINRNIVNFYKAYGFTAEMYGSVHYLIGLGGRDAIEDLLSVSHYNKRGVDGVYQNEDALPMGVVFSSYVTEKEMENEKCKI